MSLGPASCASVLHGWPAGTDVTPGERLGWGVRHPQGHTQSEAYRIRTCGRPIGTRIEPPTSAGVATRDGAPMGQEQPPSHGSSSTATTGLSRLPGFVATHVYFDSMDRERARSDSSRLSCAGRTSAVAAL